MWSYEKSIFLRLRQRSAAILKSLLLLICFISIFEKVEHLSSLEELFLRRVAWSSLEELPRDP